MTGDALEIAVAAIHRSLRDLKPAGWEPGPVDVVVENDYIVRVLGSTVRVVDYIGGRNVEAWRFTTHEDFPFPLVPLAPCTSVPGATPWAQSVFETVPCSVLLVCVETAGCAVAPGVHVGPQITAHWCRERAYLRAEEWFCVRRETLVSVDVLVDARVGVAARRGDDEKLRVAREAHVRAEKRRRWVEERRRWVEANREVRRGP